MHRNRLLPLLATLALVAPSAFAQGVTGSAMTGAVTDKGGGPLTGVAIVLKNPATGDAYAATSGTDGRYFLDNVRSGGPYTLTANLQGYKQAIQEDINLSLGQRLTTNLTLVPNDFVEEIAVVAHLDALGDKKRGGPQTTVKATTITTLPLQGRNFTDLVNTDPRVVSIGSGVSMGGQNNRFNNIQIDGGANNDIFGLAANGTPSGQANSKPLSLEAVQEFVVQVAPFDVRQGSFVGGLVNAVTKSGTNDFHGGLFGYYQSRDLANKNSYFWKNGEMTYDTDPNFLTFNTGQFGGFLGGPIVKDKAHFFASVDIQQRQQTFGNAFQISGVDSAADIAKAGFDVSVADKFNAALAKYGITNAGNALPPDLGNPDRNIFVKVDTSVIPDSKLEVSYNFVKAQQDVLIRSPTAPAVPTGPTVSGNLRDGYELSNSGYGQANSTNTARVKLTTNFGDGSWSNELLAGVSIIRDERALPDNTPLILVKATCSTCPAGSGKIGSSDSWLAAGAERFSQANILDQDVYQLQDNLTLSTERHRVTFGTTNEFFKFRNVFLQASIGVWSFDNIDQFEAGNPSSYQRRFGIPGSGQEPGTSVFNVSQLGAYVQDEWSVLDNLTITPGIRLDVPFLSKAITNPVLLSAKVPIDTGVVPTKNLLWSPRIGFNWDVGGDADTIIRGGVGVFSGRPPYVWVSNAYSVNGLAQVQLTCAGAGNPIPHFTPDPNAQPSDCAGGTNPPTAPVNQGEIDYFDPDTKYPQVLRTALGLDQRLPFGIVANADLMYSEDVNGWYTIDDNLNFGGYDSQDRAVYGTRATVSGAFRATPSRPETALLTNAVKVYNKNGAKAMSGTIQASKQFSRRYGLSVAYTYARSYDRISFTSSQAFSNFQFAPLDGDLANRNARPSAFDRPHKITVTGTAELPYGFLLGVSYIGISGTPYTWTVNGDVNADGVNGNDLVFVPADPSQISLSGTAAQQKAAYDQLAKFIDSQSCLKDAKGSFVQRGACRNPWQDFLDARVTWRSPDLKGTRFELQWDIFNILNLLNSRWGHLNSVATFENAPSSFLRAVGYDTANNRPLYTFAAPGSIVQTIYSPTASRWRMQFGGRFLF